MDKLDKKELKENFANKMLKEKLDFLPLEESLELYNNWIKLETKFWWVYDNEELSWDNWDLEFRWDNLDEIKQEMMKVHNKETFVVWKSYDEFNEFTTDICPAPTYIDLIK